MIIVKLNGGLGNQMFQYAAARRLALVNGASLKLDLGWFADIPSGDTPRRYELGAFKTVQEIASPAEVKALRGTDIRRWPKVAKRLAQSLGLFAKPGCCIEKHFHFAPEILQLRGEVYLDGYWQSEKYFIDVADTIRTEFTLTTDPTSLNKELAGVILDCEAVSLHVRRGDYLTNNSASQHHVSNPSDYYRAAIAEMSARVRNPHFFVFSDDPVWVKDNLLGEAHMTCMEHNGPDQGCEDLRLMSVCRHHIIANSSFSWWGAWLSTYPEKIVIAPKAWFHGNDVDTSDLLPTGWLRR